MNSFSIPLGASVPFKSVALLDLRESVRARWFLVYLLIFGGAVVILISLGITESQVMGFTGLTRAGAPGEIEIAVRQCQKVLGL